MHLHSLGIILFLFFGGIMEIKQRIEQYFNTHLEVVSINTLMKHLNLGNESKEEVYNVLYELELSGYIIGAEDLSYMHVPKDCYLKCGVVNLSSKNNFYINLEHGKKIIITDKNIKDLVEGDTVFVETKQSSKNKNQLYGHIVRVVKKPTMIIKNYMIKSIIKRDKFNKHTYIEIDEKRYYINSSDLKGAYPGDEVTLSIQMNGDNYRIKVIDIINRKSGEHVLEYRNIQGKYMWVPVGGLGCEIILDIEEERYKEGDRILVSLDKDNNATYIKDICNDNSLSSTIESLAYDWNIPYEFSEETLKECDNLVRVISEEEISKRVDLRHLPTYTIDGEKAKDLDDAVALEMDKNHFILYVSIADVSHYVSLTSAIFKDAVKRGTSIYPVNMVIPMLPKVLSNDLCSLTPGVDKLTKTCRLEIDKYGNVVDYQIFNSIINSNMKMSYKAVNKILDGQEFEIEYIPYYKNLIEMCMLANLLQKRRLERGYICFESDEIEFDLNVDGKVIGVKNRNRGQAQLMIENFMLLANEYIASFAYNLDVPFIYRDHDVPDLDKISKLKDKLKNFSHYIKSLNNVHNPKIFQQVFIKICENKSLEEIMMISKVMLKSMSKAYYSSNSSGHYGLALENYATFTSPIRRLPDLLNHFIIGCILDGDIEKLERYIDLFAELAYISTETQIRAEEFEEEINGILMRSYANEFIGEILEGKIIFILNNLVYIKTSNNLIGMLRVNKNQIRGNKVSLDKHLYKIGEPLYVKIDYISEDINEIYFDYMPKEKVLEKRNLNG